MKVNFMCLVARNKNNEVVFAEPIQDVYSTVYMTLSSQDIDLQDVLNFAKNIFGDRVYECYGKKIDIFLREGEWTEQQEAKDLCGSYGDVTVSIESFEKDVV